ncbi:hypothetical protein MTO96_024775 [Rhipicephalus appendiculatus]
MVRSYPCLYDKSNVDFKDKELRANRWHIIGQQFVISGEQAAAKFKNFRDRWLKISMEKRKARKSGAPARTGKGNPSGPTMTLSKEPLHTMHKSKKRAWYLDEEHMAKPPLLFLQVLPWVFNATTNDGLLAFFRVSRGNDTVDSPIFDHRFPSVTSSLDTVLKSFIATFASEGMVPG